MIAGRSVPVLLVLIAMATGGCSNKAENCTPNFSPGDRFRITIKSLRSGETSCSLLTLSPGDSFVLTAGTAKNYDPDARDCYTYAAAPEVPSFSRDIVRACTAGDQTLGLHCEGVTGNGCSVQMDMQVGDVPSVSQGVNEHGGFQFGMFGGQYVDGGAPCGWDPACDLNQFDVRIERLAPGADAGS